MKYLVEHPQRNKSYLGVMLRVRLQKKKKAWSSSCQRKHAVGMVWPMTPEGFGDQSHFYYNIFMFLRL